MKYTIILFMLCLIGCNEPKKTKCSNGLLYEQSENNPQIYTKVLNLNYTVVECVN